MFFVSGIVTTINYFSIFKINFMIIIPCMFSYDRAFFNSFYIPNKHKISTATTLIHRAQTLPNTYTGKQDELNHITKTLKCNGYLDQIIKQILRDLTPNTLVPSPEELVGQFFKRFDEKPSGCHFDMRKGNNRRISTYFTETKHQGDD